MSTLEVLAIGPSATVQSAAREGAASLGVPAGGPLNPEAMSAALAAVGGQSGDAALELPLLGARFRAHGSLVVSVDGAALIELVDGATYSVPIVSRAVRYLAVRGGIDVPLVLGARGTCLPGGFGGWRGRVLRRGDLLPIGVREAMPPPSSAPLTPGSGTGEALACLPTARARARLDAGDSDHALALAALLAQSFTVDARSDRVGTRLSAGSATLRRLAQALQGSATRSRPTTRGAIQLPPDGQPIVLGPDAPTVGGYPVLAVLEREASALLARRRPGEPVAFRLSAAYVST